MTTQEKKALLARAEKLKPRPQLMPSGKWICTKMVNRERVSATGDTPEQAHAKALALANGILEKSPKKDKMTLDDAIQAYIKAGEGTLSPTTVRGYDVIRRNRFQGIMKENIYTLNRLKLQEAVSEESKLVSAKTVANSFGLICSVLSDYGITISGVKMPQKKKIRKQYLTTQEIVKLIDAAVGDSCEVPILLAVWLGMRRSEIAGLCWDCVDFEAGTVEVRRVYVPGKDNQFILREGTKNEMSQRIIVCPNYILDKIKALPREANNRVIQVHPEAMRRHVHDCCKRAGITDTTIHGLRHANAAVMISLNIVDKYAMARNGWTSEYTFKQIYGYVFPEGAENTDKTVNEFFENAIGISPQNTE